MRHYLLIFLLLGATLFSCKKDSDPQPADNTTPANNTPADPYAANLGLVANGADFYLIADVTGIAGVSKINWQLSTVAGATTSAFNGVCNGNEYHTGYIVGHNVQPDYFWFVVFFQTTASSGFTNLVHTGDYTFCTPADDVNGIDISFLDAEYHDWRCKYLNNNTISGSNFKVTRSETVGGTKYLEARFNCQLKKYSGNEIITLSNAVFKAHW